MTQADGNDSKERVGPGLAGDSTRRSDEDADTSYSGLVSAVVSANSLIEVAAGD
jgi:hypothetical protein